MQMKRETVLDMAGGGIPASFCLLLHSSVSSVFTTCCVSIQSDVPFFPPSCHSYFLSLHLCTHQCQNEGSRRAPSVIVDSLDTTPTLVREEETLETCGRGNGK